VLGIVPLGRIRWWKSSEPLITGSHLHSSSYGVPTVYQALEIELGKIQTCACSVDLTV
jgi:hypothetical protein